MDGAYRRDSRDMSSTDIAPFDTIRSCVMCSWLIRHNTRARKNLHFRCCHPAAKKMGNSGEMGKWEKK